VIERVKRRLSAIYSYVQQWLSDLPTGPDSSWVFKVSAHQSTIPQTNMTPHPVTLN